VSDGGAKLPVLALGVGAGRGVAVAELAELARAVLAESGFTSQAVACIASLDRKSDEPAILALGEAYGVPVRFFDAATLSKEEARVPNPSEHVRAIVGTPSSAEAAALAAAGPGGRLIVTKRKSARATCAIAMGPA
jgi:cobalt-precorrin 5A hydrolase/precorrin-3B C17-methyltransferase